MPFFFHSEDVTCHLANESATVDFLHHVVTSENCQAGDINIVFCSDEHLHQLNQSYLNHDTLTDIITFDYSNNSVLTGDLFISIERAHENADLYNVSVNEELHRLFVHGILHLAGYTDKTNEDNEKMRAKEDVCLKELSNHDVSRGTSPF
ncbi:MAG: rRNA maturation RNase YbeY [Bacteroidetes bacterium SW_11_45_7]|nr:MAG: rRNA maturation RNase YbeY [Bacteroidetes bacterium SW_11_45_7]